MNALAVAKRLGRGLAIVAVIGTVGSVLLPLVPTWPFLLFEHFRLQYLVVGVLVVAACGALRLTGWFDIAAIATLVNLWWVAPDLGATARPIPRDGKPLRVLVVNVHTSSAGYAAVRQLIADTNPDVIGLVEVDHAWLAQLAPALAAYPNHFEDPRTDNFGIALFTRLPAAGGITYLGDFPSAIGKLDLGGTPVDVIVTHPIPPISRYLFASQESQLAKVAAHSRTLGPARIVMGDFNATPWSRPFRDFVATSGLCDTRAGFGLQASFPSWSAILSLPIDHVLVSCSIGVRARTVERDVGSDHFPVVVDLVIPR